MQEDCENIITEIMDLSWNNCEDLEVLKEIDEILQCQFKLSYLEYATIRNELLIEHNYKLPIDILQETIINKMIIKLVNEGLLEIDLNIEAIKGN